MKTVKVKTSELTGAALDWAVAEAEGLMPSNNWTGMYYRPSTDWGVTGLLIEKHNITLNCAGKLQVARKADCKRSVLGLGASRLVAVCRLVVALKIGDTVEVPEQLVEVD